MKTLKFSTIAALVLICISFISCEKNDDPSYDSNALIGKWKLTWSEGYEKNAENPEDNQSWNAAAPSGYFLVIATNGSGYFDADQERDTFSWQLTGEMLTLTDTDSESDSFRIVRLDTSTLTLETNEQEEGYEFHSVETFKKVN